jgi:replicative superfamily II helicase
LWVVQCRVLELVDRDRSAVVCAPTSSGKTVISTYVAVKIAEEAEASSSSSEGGVLFVVPSEPLVWQVVAQTRNPPPFPHARP